jgi:RsiW-degrading membrane proteinase PrsW (M82 family)
VNQLPFDVRHPSLGSPKGQGHPPLITHLEPFKKTPFNLVVWIGIILGGIVIGGTLIFYFIESPKAILLGGGLSLLPLACLFTFYRWADSYEPEPKTMLLLAFIWGAVAATGASLVFNIFNMAFFGITAATVIGAPLVEETFKGVFLLLILFWKRGDFDGVMDGIIYAGIVAGGFAMVENIVYFNHSFRGISMDGNEVEGGPLMLLATFITRGIASPFIHPLCTTFTGVGVGLAVAKSSKTLAFWLYPFLGWLGAVSLHFVWNGSTLLGGFFIPIYLFFFIPLFIGFIKFVVNHKKNMIFILWVALEDAAKRGLLPAEDIPWLLREKDRRRALAYARNFGRDKYLSMKAYQKAAIKLGFLHYKVLNQAAPKDFRFRGQKELTIIAKNRPFISFPR